MTVSKHIFDQHQQQIEERATKNKSLAQRALEAREQEVTKREYELEQEKDRFFAYQARRRGPKGRDTLTYETRYDMIEKGLISTRVLTMLNLYIRLEWMIRYEFQKFTSDEQKRLRRLHRAIDREYLTGIIQ